ncbi:hypothetical protein RB195_006692 [Necator americanus]|uniref:Uncharacterized protein n=1 Tax=Necator americanus TaxID=51031 RepID=A0ABR1BX65_NECAM
MAVPKKLVLTLNVVASAHIRHNAVVLGVSVRSVMHSRSRSGNIRRSRLSQHLSDHCYTSRKCSLDESAAL